MLRRGHDGLQVLSTTNIKHPDWTPPSLQPCLLMETALGLLEPLLGRYFRNPHNQNLEEYFAVSRRTQSLVVKGPMVANQKN